MHFVATTNPTSAWPLAVLALSVTAVARTGGERATENFDMLGPVILILLGLLLGVAGPYWLADMVSQIGFTFSSGKTFVTDGVVFMRAAGIVLTLTGTVWLLSSRSVEVVTTPEKPKDGDDPPDP